MTLGVFAAIEGLAWRCELQADSASHNQDEAPDACGAGRLAEQHHSGNRGARGADAGPDRQAVPNGTVFSDTPSKPKLRTMATQVATLGQKRVNPAQYFSPSPQMISRNPASSSASQAI